MRPRRATTATIDQVGGAPPRLAVLPDPDAPPTLEAGALGDTGPPSPTEFTAAPASTPAGDVLWLQGISVRRGGREVLRVPDLALAHGEVLAVIGPNGAGKSTLLQVAALLQPPDQGAVWIGGQRADRRAADRLRRRLAVVFQAPLLFDRSVLHNAACGLRFRGVGRKEAEARARDWLARFGVDHLAQRPARALSGGEAQRVALARALALAPDLLLLDEPFSALDAPTRAALLPELAARLRETGTAAVVVTHDQAEAMALADRLAILIGGQIAQVGPVAEVAARPASTAAAHFLGIANVLPGRVAGRHADSFAVALAPNGPQILAASAAGSPLTIDDQVELALPANAISLVAGAPPPGWNLLQGRLVAASVLPAGRRLVVDCGVLLTVALPLLADQPPPAVGSPVALAFPPAATHLIPVRPSGGAHSASDHDDSVE